MSIKIADIKVELIDHMGTDLSVVNAARVSFDKKSEFEVDPNGGVCTCEAWYEHECCCGNFHPQLRLKQADVKLINYLAKHKHFSPFNHTFITLKVKAPVFVARQLVKHEYMPWNEESRRYISSEPEFYFPDQYRKAAANVKQGSSDEIVDTNEIWPDSEDGYDEFGSVQYALNYYNWLLAKGVCAEQARMFLPQNMMVNWYWSGTLKAFSKMLNLRLEAHSQRETQKVAEQAVSLIEPLFPVSLKALLDNP